MDEQSLFLTALEHRDPQQRREFLDQACRGNDSLRQRIAELLQKHDDLGSFLERPPHEVLATFATGRRHSGERVEVDVQSFLTSTDKPGVLGLLGPYEVLNVIGRGGMGIVLRALDPKLNRIVAVKVLAPELAANPNARKRFLREAQAAAAISHPHVVTIHAVEDGASPQSAASGLDATPLPYLVMECIVGQSLQEKLDRVGSLSLTEILRIGQQISIGLAAAHKQGLIHRDIKPANILLENGVERVKITDFGLARLVDDVNITRTGEVSGTPQYMSPEQAKGERVDQRSDLFSLGCVLYAMCTGHSPFRGDSLAHVILRVTQDAPRSIEELNPDIPAWLVEVINHLLDKAPERRFQTATELGDLLGAHLARQQHAAPGGLSHAGINALYRPTVQPRSEPGRRPVVAAAAAAGIVRLIRVPWYWRLCGALLLVIGGVFVASHLLSGLMAHFNPAMTTRMGTLQDHLVPALLFLFPAVSGWLLTRKWGTSQALLGILLLGLGPLGLAIWLVRRDVWETEAVDAETAREMDRLEESTQPELDSALRAVVFTAVIATVLAIGFSILVPIPDVVDLIGKAIGGAAFAALVLWLARPFVAERLGTNGRRLVALASPPLWTLICVPLLTIVGYDAVAVHSVREPYIALLILMAATWLIPVAAMLYFLGKSDSSVDSAQRQVADQHVADRRQPSRILPWIAVIALVVIVAAPLLYSRLKRGWQGDTVPVAVNYDPEFPIHSIVDENHDFTWTSDRRPFPLELAPGVHALTVRYSRRGVDHAEFTKSVTIAPNSTGRPLTLDLTADIEHDRKQSDL